MPADRFYGPKQIQKNLSQGQKFALALGLEDQPNIFHDCKAAFRRLADRTFNFDLPLFQQQAAMSAFVEQVVFHFPGFFNDTHENNKERLDALQHYARSYLEKSGKLATRKRKKKKSTKSRPSDALPSTPPSPPKSNIIKVQRPRPKPAYRVKTTSTLVEEPNLDSPSVETGIPNQTSAHSKPAAKKQNVPLQGLYSREQTIRIDEPMPDASSFVTAAPIPPPVEDKDMASSSRHASLADFLAGCCPAMGHREVEFRRAGVSEGTALVGMARWEEKKLRNFLTRYKIALTPLEEQALVLGFAYL